MVRSKFDARFQYLIIAAAQYAAPALTVVFSLAILVHVSGGGGGGISETGLGDTAASSAAATSRFAAGSGGAGGHGLGICDAARRVVGLQPWDTAFAAAAAVGGNGAAGLEGGPVGSPRDLAGVLKNIPEVPEAFWSGVAGFLAWWACLSWAVTYAMGVVFWRVYPEDISAVERVRSATTTKGKMKKVKGKAKAKGGSKGGGGGGEM